MFFLVFIVKSFGNMSPGFEFDLNGHHFFGSEQAYICGLFSDGSTRHTEIQKLLQAETNGYASKKKIRNKNDNIKRLDWETFNIEWMKYVVWNKVKGNETFQKLLLSVPLNAMIVENSTLQTPSPTENHSAECTTASAISWTILKRATLKTC